MNKQMTKKSRGILVVALIGLCIVGIAGWHFATNKLTPLNAGGDTNAVTDSTFLVTYLPLVGGGFTGAVSEYEIHANGDVFNASKSDYRAQPKKTLIKRVDQATLADLYQALTSSGVLALDPGKGPQYSGRQLSVTINGETKTFYDLSSTKFGSVKSRVSRILDITIQ